MSLPIKFFHVVATNRLVQSATSLLNFALPDLVSGSRLSIEYAALDGNGPPYDQFLVAEYSGPQIGIFSAAGVQLAYQNAFTADSARNVYVGELSLNDAALTAAVAALTPAASLLAYFTINVIDPNGLPVQLPPTPINLWKALIVPGAVTVAPTDTAATQEWALNTFLKNDRDGTPWKVKSLDGTKTFLRWLDNDGIERSQLLA